MVQSRYSIDDVAQAEELKKARLDGYQAGLDKGYKRGMEEGYRLGYAQAKDEMLDSSCRCGGACKNV